MFRLNNRQSNQNQKTKVNRAMHISLNEGHDVRCDRRIKKTP